MLRLPDPEAGSGTEAAPSVPVRASGPGPTARRSHPSRPVFTVAEPAREEVLADVAELRSGARNPLFRSSDGGAGGEGGQERAPRRSARRTGRRDTSAYTARRAVRASIPTRGEAVDGEPTQGRPDRGRTGAEQATPAAVRAECYACPVGSAFETLRDASPDAVDHLMAASRELVAAARAVMAALEANLERRAGPRARRVEHVDLD